MAALRTLYGTVLTLTVIVLETFFWSPGLGADQSHPRPVRVGVFDLEPLSCSCPDMRGDTRPVLGLIFDHIAHRENWRVTIVGGTLQELEALLSKADIDLLLAAPYSRDKSTRFQYSRQNVISTWARVYAPEGSQVQSLLDLKGRSVGVVKNSPYNQALRRLLEQFNINAAIVEFDRPEAVLQGISEHWIDAGAVDRFFGILTAERYPVQETMAVFSPIELRFAAPLSAKGDLLEAIDYHFTILKQDKGSLYHQLLNRALVTPERSRLLEYLSWGLAVAAAGVLLFGGIAVLLRQQVKSHTRELAQKKADLIEELKQRKAAETAARKNEERYRSAFNNTSAGMILFDDSLRIHAANTVARTLSGFTNIGAPAHNRLTDFILPEDLQRIRATADVNAELGLPLSSDLELRIMDCHGTIKHVLGRINAIPETGQYIASVIDITERIRGEAERVRLATAIEQSTDSIFITDKDRRIIYMNPAFEEMTGHGRDAVIGRTPEFLWVNPSDDARIANIIAHTDGGHTWRGRLTNRRKDGTTFETQTAISPIRDPAGVITNYVNVKRDISVECRLEDQLREAQKMQAVGTLAGGIAHDFNNILAAIMGYTEISLYDLPEEAPSRGRLLQVLSACDRAKDLIGQILTFSRKDDASQKPMSLGVVVNEAIKLLRATLPPAITFYTTKIDTTSVIKANATQMHQIVMNLCTNAAYAMRSQANGDLSVSLQLERICEHQAGTLDLKPGRYLVLSVSDSGTGMDRDTRQRLFEPFFTTKPKSEGTGLGLSVVHGIVKSHAGAVTVDSAVGKGTTFRLYFPEAAGAQTAAAENVKQLPRGKGEILFVDDEKMLTATADELISCLGYTLSVFNSPLQALNRFNESPERFDLVVTDYHMPKMDGLSLAARIHALRPDMPIVLCTGYKADLSATTLSECGILHILDKPFQHMELAGVIHDLISRPKADGARVSTIRKPAMEPRLAAEAR
ncbi:MAG: PAS domain S-box protein [Pseudomonadota bacterium]